MKKLIQNKLFMTLFASDLLSNFGDVMYYLALMSYVLQLQEVKLAIAIVSLSETLPILTGFIAGYFADRKKDKITTILHTLLFRVGLYLMVGLLMGFAPGLWVVIAVSIINFLSDMAGQYENSLYTPVSLRIVADEDRADSFAFRQAVSFVTSIAFQSAGAVLVSVMSFQALAVVNAATFAACFAIVFLVKPRLEALLKERPLQIEEKSDRPLFSDLWSSMKMAIAECRKIPEIRKSMVIVPILNGFFNILSIIIPVIISQDQHFIIINPVTTLATISVFTLIGGLIGSILAMNIFKNLNTLTTIRLCTLFVPIFSFFLYIHNIYGVLLTFLLTLVLTATVNPKMNALIMNNLPEEKLGLISGGIGTYFQLGTIFARILVSGLILILPVDWISLLLLGIGFVLLFYVFAGKTSRS